MRTAAHSHSEKLPQSDYQDLDSGPGPTAMPEQLRNREGSAPAAFLERRFEADFLPFADHHCAAPCHAVVWRQGYAVYHSALSMPESEALAGALRGGTLAEVMEPFAEQKHGAKAAFKALASWLAEGMVSALLPPGE